jgi:protein-disulfide isomerase
MNRKSVIVMTIVAALGMFAVGAFLYSPTPEKTATAMPDSNKLPLIRFHSPVIGPSDAPVTIVEFFDPACESCRAFHPIVKEILSKFQGKVRVVFRYAALHPQSEEAIRVLETARIQGKFEAVLERLLETQPKWAPHGREPVSIWELIKETGIDVERARRDANLPAIGAILNQDMADVIAVGIRGTPTFFVNGKQLKDFGAQQLHDLVKSEVELSERPSKE